MRPRPGHRRRLIAGCAALAAAGLFVITMVGTASGTTTTLATYTTPGAYSWTVPTGVTKITFTVYGASGGNVAYNGTLEAVGGLGGEVKGMIAVKPGEVFEIDVGGRGGDANGFTGGSGGSNGGRRGADGSSPAIFAGGGGGGVSAVLIGSSGTSCATLPCADGERFLVAGGGGGASATYNTSADGGAGGGFFGRDGQSYVPSVTGRGGSQDGGGVGADAGSCFSNSCSGTLIFGGYGSAPGGGGGGGGYYGGGGGWDGFQVNGQPSPAAAGGGSGYYTGLALSASFPGGTRSGNGKVVIQTP